jgi:hypothetical protein
MKRPVNILLRLLLVAIPLLLALAPARAQNDVYAGQTTDLSVIEVPGETYTWELYNDVIGVNVALVPGNCTPAEAFFVGGINTGATVQVTWLVPGTYYYKVTAVNDCPTNNLRVGIMLVLPALPTATLVINPEEVCRGDSADMLVHFTGEAPWSIIIEADDGINPPVTNTYSDIYGNPFVISVSPSTTTTYRVIQVSDANGINTDPSNVVTLTIKPRPAGSTIYQYQP